MTYRDMLKRYARVRGFKNAILTVPVMTPKLSSYWLYFVTSTSYKLEVNLVDSMKVEVVARDNRLQEMLGIKTLTYEEAIEMAFQKIAQNSVVSSWKDSLVSGRFRENLDRYIQVPKYGVLTDKKSVEISDREAVLDNIWRIGGDTGWYYGSWLWQIRGFLDKLSGGVGLRRGRTHPDKIYAGDALDFWRVEVLEERRLLRLRAEMKLPGRAWLQFEVEPDGGGSRIRQTAIFDPHGLTGLIYWYALWPVHQFVFGGMLRRIGAAATARGSG